MKMHCRIKHGHCKWHRLSAGLTILAALMTVTAPAAAYIGPGAGLSALGALLALVVGLIVAIVGFIWYPLRRLLRKRRSAVESETDMPGSQK